MAKTIEEVMAHTNLLHYPPHIAESILRRNVRTQVIPFGIDNVRFISLAISNKEYKTFGNARHPFPLGEEGVYISTGEGKILGLASFSIYPEESKLSIVQIQGTKANQLTHIERKMQANLPWEQGLIDVIEGIAKWSEYSEVHITSAWRLQKVISGRLNGNKLVLRYDIPAIERGYAPVKEDWYGKNI